jgi:hypothetical protein
LALNKHSLIAAALATALFAVIPRAEVWALDKPACEQFDWSIAREQSLFASPALKKVSSGAALDQPGAAALELSPNASVAFVLPPARQPKTADSFGGVLTVNNLAAGTYQITLSSEAWIDVIQDGKTVDSTAHSGKRGCADVRKTVRFQLKVGTATIQLSGATTNAVNIAVLPEG